MDSVHEQWKDRAEDTKKFCSEEAAAAAAQTTDAAGSSSPSCEYVWAVNKMTKTKSRQDVTARLAPVLVQSENWTATGFPVRHPRAGYSAKGRGAFFEIAIPIQKRDNIQHLAIIAMQSYSAEWKNAMVKMTVPRTRLDRMILAGITPPRPRSWCPTSLRFPRPR
jgi:hypothetical protein